MRNSLRPPSRFADAITLLTAAAGLFGASALAAPHMTPVAVTGFNRDVVVENTANGPPFTAYAQEMNAVEGTAYYQTGLYQYAWGLPTSGAFVSLVGDGTNETGTLTLNFSDGTSNVTTFYAPDWESGSGNVAWFGPGKIDLTTGEDSTGPEEPSFYQTTVNIAALMGATNKPLASITFGKTVSQSSAIYAVSGLLAGDAPAPSTPIAATGWNRDLVIENTASGPPYTGPAKE